MSWSILYLDKIKVLETKNQELEKKYNKSINVIEKLEAENIETCQEVNDLRQYKKDFKLQESKISSEYEGLLKEYKEQVKRLQDELMRLQNQNDELRNSSMICIIKCNYLGMNRNELTHSQMPSSHYYKQNETHGPSVHEHELHENTSIADHNNNSVTEDNMHFKNSLPIVPENDYDQYEQYFNEWAQSLN